MKNSVFRLVTVLMVFVVSIKVQANDFTGFGFTDPEKELNEDSIRARLDSMTSEVVPPQFDQVVMSYLRTYTVKRREVSEKILGRKLVYFPLFEEKLKESGLPTDLKYLSVVESALDPNAVSRVGATGLWQFMPRTGAFFGLEINKLVDERRDPTRATEAAIIYLSRLYERFNDWELAIAAYNSGEGRVSRAVKRARSKDFWRLRRFLPRETRNYVPAFIAATYLMKYYKEHDLVPEQPALDLQLSQTITVYDTLTFYEIAQVTSLPLDILEQMNPAYKSGIIPAKETGHYLTLPGRVMPAFKEYLDKKRPDYEARRKVQLLPVYISRALNTDKANYDQRTYTVKKGERLEDIAKKVGCAVHQLKAWNNLANPIPQEGEKLTIYVPKSIKRFEARDFKELPKIAPARPLVRLRPHNDHIEELREQIIEHNGYLCYKLKKREYPFEIASKLLFINYNNLMRLNDLKINEALTPGTLLKIKRIPLGGK